MQATRTNHVEPLPVASDDVTHNNNNSNTPVINMNAQLNDYDNPQLPINDPQNNNTDMENRDISSDLDNRSSISILGTDDEDDDFTQPKKKVNADVVLLMDSNRKYIVPDRLCGRGRTKKIRCAEAKDITNIAKQHDLHKVKHLFIGAGTNDVGNNDRNSDDIAREVDDIAHDIISGAEEIHKDYPQLNIYIIELPPRRNNYQMKTKKVNQKLRSLLPKEFSLVQHGLTIKNMEDDKHVREKDIRFLVTNMKNEMWANKSAEGYASGEQRDIRNERLVVEIGHGYHNEGNKTKRREDSRNSGQRDNNKQHYTNTRKDDYNTNNYNDRHYTTNNWNNRRKPTNNRYDSKQHSRNGYSDGQKYNLVPYDYNEENNEQLFRSFVQYLNLKNNS